MNFTVSTKPLSDALNLGVINSNISKYYQKSCLAQLTADRHTLRINLEAARISTELILKGSGDVDETVSVFVDCQTLKSLVGTFEAGVTTIEFIDGGIVLHSGSSKFTMPKIVDADDISLTRPALPEANSPKIKLNKEDWKFVDDHQMYAIAMSFVYPIYTKVWVGQDGDVIVGDYNNSIFTFSKKSALGRSCLLSDTIVNLFTSVPEGAELTQLNDTYRIDVKTDAFEYAAEFAPQYEDGDNEGAVGNYMADDIKAAATVDGSNCIKVAVPNLIKFLNQADLLDSSSDKVINMKYDSATSQVTFHDDNIDCKLPVQGTSISFEAPFNSSLLKPVLNNMDEDSVDILPILQEGDMVAGILVKSKALSVMLGAEEDM